MPLEQVHNRFFFCVTLLNTNFKTKLFFQEYVVFFDIVTVQVFETSKIGETRCNINKDIIVNTKFKAYHTKMLCEQC